MEEQTGEERFCATLESKPVSPHPEFDVVLRRDTMCNNTEYSKKKTRGNDGCHVWSGSICRLHPRILLAYGLYVFFVKSASTKQCLMFSILFLDELKKSIF